VQQINLPQFSGIGRVQALAALLGAAATIALI
jgi:hypothetical protein